MERSSRRRVVLDDARRKIERALLVAAAAEELAAAADAVLSTARAGRDSEEGPRLDALRAALAKYRVARGG